MPLRRAIAAALVALQCGIAVSPMLERANDGRLESHVEALGSRHPFAHDEATCAVCAARMLVRDVPPTQVPLHLVAMRNAVDVPAPEALHSARLAPDNHSRAPPTVQ